MSRVHPSFNEGTWIYAGTIEGKIRSKERDGSGRFVLSFPRLSRLAVLREDDSNTTIVVPRNRDSLPRNFHSWPPIQDYPVILYDDPILDQHRDEIEIDERAARRGRTTVISWPVGEQGNSRFGLFSRIGQGGRRITSEISRRLGL